MPRQRDHFELVLYGATLRKMAKRIQRDYDQTYERCDIVRGTRHARRLEMIEHRFFSHSPCEGVSGYSDIG